MHNLPHALYKVDSVVRLEQLAIHQYGIPAYELMKRAGKAVFDVLCANYSHYKKILVLCGAGNNAGDGYVVAGLAKQAGFNVNVVSLIKPELLKNEAQLAYQDWLAVAATGENKGSDDISSIKDAEIIVDALLGTGLTRELSSPWSEWVDAVNQSSLPVVSVDIPSGLFADTGVVAGVAIKADMTVCFIGLKQGMFTAQGKDVCGEVVFSSLALPDEVYAGVECDAQLLDAVDYSMLPARKASSHKGDFGHVLIVGGNAGMPGAAILAATAALRSGAGLVTIITIPQHLAAISAAVPEAMVKCCELDSMADLFAEPFLGHITHVAVGMGLGQDEWSLTLLQHCLHMNKPMLLDADALNLMARHGLAGGINLSSALVITPHPGEASRLLSNRGESSSAAVQQNRFQAIRQLHDLFGSNVSCTVILKGSGTLIFDGQMIKVCTLGNAAMAAPGMGDVLSGIIIGLMAQNITAVHAAELGVCLHAAAADLIVENKTRGLLASDVTHELAKVLR